MQLIPVIDLMSGQVVRAQGGQRASYAPIDSPICENSDPVHVSRVLIEKTQSDILYIADLDAITTEQTNNFDQIKLITETLPDIQIWLDAGFSSLEQLHNWERFPSIQCVIGSEMHTTLNSLSPLLELATILSLDFKAESFLGPEELLKKPEFWPESIIVMTLSSVGSQAGPDFEKLRFIQSNCSSIKEIDKKPFAIFAAGGIRDQADINTLADMSISGALVSSALHSGTL